MTLDQLVNPEEYGVLPDLWLSQSPPGERLPEYVDRDRRGLPHVGETPPLVIREVIEFSNRAVAEVDAANPLVSANCEEFQRLRNDIHCIRSLSQYYGAKVEAAEYTLRYHYSGDISDLNRAAERLATSVDHFRELVELTKDHYQFANSMQTEHRQIPVVGAINGRPANYCWTQLLSVYERELASFRERVHSVSAGTQRSDTMASP